MDHSKMDHSHHSMPGMDMPSTECSVRLPDGAAPSLLCLPPRSDSAGSSLVVSFAVVSLGSRCQCSGTGTSKVPFPLYRAARQRKRSADSTRRAHLPSFLPSFLDYSPSSLFSFRHLRHLFLLAHHLKLHHVHLMVPFLPLSSLLFPFFGPFPPFLTLPLRRSSPAYLLSPDPNPALWS
jgi:hypothetical protein